MKVVLAIVRALVGILRIMLRSLLAKKGVLAGLERRRAVRSAAKRISRIHS